jgi:hypothetical protein
VDAILDSLKHFVSLQNVLNKKVEIPIETPPRVIFAKTKKHQFYMKTDA